MFVLGSKFIIGKYRFRGCNAVVIRKSIHELAQTATIKLPNTSVLKQNGIYTESKQTAQAFAVNDKVTIQLAYNDRFREEFVGFVKNINKTTPCEIECEGYSYLLRTKKNIKKTWKSAKLKEVLEYLVEGTGIKLHSKIPDMPLRNLVVNNASAFEVIEYIKDLLKGVLTAFFIGDTLYVGLTYMDLANTTVKHRLGWNVIKDDDLKFKCADDVKVKIELQFRKGSGQQVTVKEGKDGGIVKRETMSLVTDEAHLKDVAKAKLLQENYDGYEGTMTTFLVPYCEPGYRDEMSDPRYPERAGNYFLESTETTFDQNGARRKLQIGIQLS